MAYRKKRADTRISNIERRYGIALHARADTKLGNLLRSRGFPTLTRLLTAARGKARSHARRRRVFLSFHAEDRQQVSGVRLMLRNPRARISLYDGSLQIAIRSGRGTYLRGVIAKKIARCEVLLCLIGNGTAWRSWVNWEIRKAKQLRKGICGVRLKNSRARVPPALTELGASVARWSVPGIIGVIEQAAAVRS